MQEAKNLILNESSAKAWLKDYLASRAEIQANRIASIHKNTKRFKTFLMYPNSESPRKTREETKESKEKADVEFKLNFNLTSSENKSPDPSQKPIMDPIYSKRTFSAEKFIIGNEEKCLKQIPSQKWSQTAWLSKQEPLSAKTSLQELLSDPDSPENKYIIYSGKQKKGEGNLEKTSLTKQLFSEFTEKKRLLRGDRDNRFGKISQRLPYRPVTGKASSSPNGSRKTAAIGTTLPKKVPELLEDKRGVSSERNYGYFSGGSSPTSIRMNESPKLSARDFSEMATNYQFKVHRAFTPISSLQSIYHDQSQPPRCEGKRSASQHIIPPIEVINPLASLENLSQKLSDLRLSGQLSVLSGGLEKSKSHQMFYNSTISRASSATGTSRPSSKSHMAVGLHIREQLIRMDKSGENNHQKKMKASESPNEHREIGNQTKAASGKPKNMSQIPKLLVTKPEEGLDLLDSPCLQNKMFESMNFRFKERKASPRMNIAFKNLQNMRTSQVIATRTHF